MKKIMMILLMTAMSGFAMDVYNVKMSIKTPKIKGGGNTYYKENSSVVYNGYLGIEYAEDGRVTNDCQMVVYYRQNGKTIAKLCILNFNSLNLMGKKNDKVECNATCSMNDCELELCGDGGCSDIEQNDVCAEQWQVKRINAFTCNVTGFLYEPLTDPCGNPCSYEFSCADNPYIVPSVNCMSGSSSCKFNSKLSKTCTDNGFWTVILNKLPSGCEFE